MPTSHRCGGKALLILCVLKKTWNYLSKIQKLVKYHKQGKRVTELVCYLKGVMGSGKRDTRVQRLICYLKGVMGSGMMQGVHSWTAKIVMIQRMNQLRGRFSSVLAENYKGHTRVAKGVV